MRTPWIPNEDSKLHTFANAFAAAVTADPARYGLTPGDADAISAAAQAFSAAYTTWKNPSTATAPNLSIKDNARAALIPELRRLGGLVRVNPDVAIADKIALGVKPIPRSYPRTPAPDAAPALSITHTGFNAHTVRFSQPTSTRNARPRGTVGLLLFRAIADTPVSDPNAAQFVAFVTRDRVNTQPPRGHAGQQATYFARWAGTKGDLGPWSMPVSTCIAA